MLNVPLFTIKYNETGDDYHLAHSTGNHHFERIVSWMCDANYKLQYAMARLTIAARNADDKLTNLRQLMGRVTLRGKQQLQDVTEMIGDQVSVHRFLYLLYELTSNDIRVYDGVIAVYSINHICLFTKDVY